MEKSTKKSRPKKSDKKNKNDSTTKKNPPKKCFKVVVRKLPLDNYDVRILSEYYIYSTLVIELLFL